MNNTGIVMEINKSHAFIMTNGGEFLKVKVGKNVPTVGEIYSGQIIKETPFYKYIATAASLAFVLLFGGTAYAYYTPTASVRVDINPSIELSVNRWNRIIKTIPLNNDGEKVLSGISLKNMSLNDGLDVIVEEAKKDNFIKDDYTESGKVIKVTIESKNPKRKPDITKFEEHTKKENLNLNISNVELEKASGQKEKKDNRNSDESNKESIEIKQNENTPANDKNDSPSNNNTKGKDKEKNDKKDNSSNLNLSNTIPASSAGKSESKEATKSKDTGSSNNGKGKGSNEESKNRKNSKVKNTGNNKK